MSGQLLKNEQVLEESKVKTPNCDLGEVLWKYDEAIKKAEFSDLWNVVCRLSNEDRIPERESRILDVIEHSEDAHMAGLYIMLKYTKRWFKGCEAELNQLYEKKKKEMETNRDASRDF